MAGTGDRAAEDLQARLAFLVEADALKSVLRRTRPVGSERMENSAEHSWHAALMAVVLAPYADEPVDVGHVVEILLVHDLVEIDAGDTFAYDDAGRETQAERERVAADRIFGLLPEEQGRALRALWDEFEERTTPEARFAHAMDRISAVLLNHANGGALWREHGLSAERVKERNAAVGDASAALWAELQARIDDAERRGWFPAT